MDVKEIPIKQIKLSRNSRVLQTEKDLSNLMQSIKEVGLLQPIGVAKSKNGYEVCYGNRRYLAISKLGWDKVPAVVFEKSTSQEFDIRNLTENVQRKNITLSECGRYVDILKKDGLSVPEIAVKLGVSKGYLIDALDMYRRIPVKYHKDIDVRNTKTKVRTFGKVSLATAKRIDSARKTYGINTQQAGILFEMAKKEPQFDSMKIPIYSGLISKGVTDTEKLLSSVVKSHRQQTNFWIEGKEKQRLVDKYVETGKFRSLAGVAIAILNGSLNETIDCRP